MRSKNSNGKIGRELGLMFKQNKTLVHVDMSNNGIVSEDCKEMAEGLKFNHTLLGLHMGGNNEVDIDVKGMLKEKPNRDPASIHTMTRIRKFGKVVS